MKENPGSISNPSVHHKYFEQLRKVLSIEFPLKKAPSQSERSGGLLLNSPVKSRTKKQSLYCSADPIWEKVQLYNDVGSCTAHSLVKLSDTTTIYNNHFFIELLWRRKTSTSEKFHLRRIVQENPFVQFEIHVRLWTRNVSMKFTGLKSLM